MVQFLPQAKINIRPEPLNFKPLANGLTDLAKSYREKQELEQRQAVGEHIANNQYGQASQEAARQGNLDQSIALTRVDQQNQKKAQEEEKRIALKTAGFIQNFIDPISDPRQKTMAVRRLVASHKNFAPALEQAGIDIRDPSQVVSFLKAQAQEFVDPREREMQDAQLGLINAKTDAARARANATRSAGEADRSKLFNMNGRLVRVGADGTAQEVYQSPELDAKVSKNDSIARNISGGLNRLASVPNEFGDDLLENSIGPIQGNDEGGVITTLGRVWGSLNLDSRGSTTEVRNRIAGDTEALAASIKPLIRKPGEGTWTDDDQKRLVSIIGNLATARDANEYLRRLDGVRQRVMSNFGIELPPIGGSQPAQGRLKYNPETGEIE
jgi:hypothetical protein